MYRTVLVVHLIGSEKILNLTLNRWLGKFRTEIYRTDVPNQNDSWYDQIMVYRLYGIGTIEYRYLWT
jgi:hypothetical protein